MKTTYFRSLILGATAATLLAAGCDDHPASFAPTGDDGVLDTRQMNTAEFDTAVHTNQALAFITVSASWCGSCRKSAPEIEAAAEELKGRVVFGRIDYDEEDELRERYEITGVPTLLIFKGGQLRAKFEGPPTKENIHEILLPFMPPAEPARPDPAE